MHDLGCACVRMWKCLHLNLSVRMYSGMRYYVCACHCDYVHGQINQGTSTFAMDPVCTRAWQASECRRRHQRFNRTGFLSQKSWGVLTQLTTGGWCACVCECVWCLCMCVQSVWCHVWKGHMLAYNVDMIKGQRKMLMIMVCKGLMKSLAVWFFHYLKLLTAHHLLEVQNTD